MYGELQQRIYEEWRDLGLFRSRKGHWGILLLSRTTLWDGMHKSDSFQRCMMIIIEQTQFGAFEILTVYIWREKKSSYV